MRNQDTRRSYSSRDRQPSSGPARRSFSEGGPRRNSWSPRSGSASQRFSKERDSRNERSSFGSRRPFSQGSTDRPERSSFSANRSPRSFSQNRFNSSSTEKPRSFGGDRFRSPRTSGGFQSGNSFGGPRRYGGGRGFSQNRRFGGGRGRRNVQQLDVSLFVRKAKSAVEIGEYVPKIRFSTLEISSILKKNIADKGFDVPTPIQDQAIPEVLNGNDVLGIANTGTGKTGAFLIPLIEKVLKNRTIKILILTPTRELAEQINEELFNLSKNTGIHSVKCIGGDKIQFQIYRLQRNYNFVVGTPGRIKDLVNRKTLDLEKFNTVVLDEVDTMLDMGFIDDIKYLIEKIPNDKQSLFFSATINNKVEKLMNIILKDGYKKISVSNGRTADRINQDIVNFSDHEDRLNKVKNLLHENNGEKVLIFVNTKREVDKLDQALYAEGFKIASIHGDKRQNYRKRAIEKFKSGQANTLIATDVAARGLDISGVALVINYDAPESYDNYIHRIGRTGRANNFGNALTFVMQR